MNGGDGNNNSFFAEYQDRADTVPGVPRQIRNGGKSQWLIHYFNPNAFTNNALGTPGIFRSTTFRKHPSRIWTPPS